MSIQEKGIFTDASIIQELMQPKEQRELEEIPRGVIIAIGGEAGVGKTYTAKKFATLNGLPEPLTIGRLIRNKSGIEAEAMSFDPTQRSPKIDRRYDELAIKTILKHPIDAPALVVESDLCVWQVEEAIKRGLDPNKVIRIKLEASPRPTGIRVLKREEHPNPENATEAEIQAAYERAQERNRKDIANWEEVYNGEAGNPYEEGRFDVVINTNKHTENGNTAQVSEAIKKAVMFVLATRDKSNEGKILTMNVEEVLKRERETLPKAS